MKDCKGLRGPAAVALALLAALTTACASGGGKVRPQPFPTPAGSAAPPAEKAPAPTPAPSLTTPRAAAPAPVEPTLVETALHFRGTPYRNGGSDPSGFDCSGFTQWVFAQHGTGIPREVHEQFKIGKKVSLDDLKPGDLVFFHTVSRGASHVGIYVAGDQFVHAPSTRGVVRVESLNSSYWAPRFLGGRRVPGAANAPPAPALARRRPSDEVSTVAAAAAARSGAQDSKAAD